LYKLNVGLREPKENLSLLVNEVKNGREIILTERGELVAKLTPVSSESLTLEARLKKLEQAGLLETANREFFEYTYTSTTKWRKSPRVFAAGSQQMSLNDISVFYGIVRQFFRR